VGYALYFFVTLSPMKKHFVFDISSHGFGHFAQSATVINQLARQLSGIDITIRTKVESRIVDSRVLVPHQIINHASDFGMLMTSALDVDREKSFSQYAELHKNFDKRVHEEARQLEKLKPDLLFSNVSYLSIAAAKKLDIPVVALCSLNWADIFNGYFNSPEASEIYHQMVDAYNLADVFLCPQPSMAMPQLKNIKNISPLAGLGTNIRRKLLARFDADEETRIVLIAPGGIPTEIPVESWPNYKDIVYITSWKAETDRRDMVDITELGYSFVDVLKSVDAVLTKPGYGTVSEAMCNHVPMMYILRHDWPEEPFLVRWCKEFGKVLEVERDLLNTGEIKKPLEALLGKEWKKPAPVPDGDLEATKIIAELVS
jgi:hypothetical protein